FPECFESSLSCGLLGKARESGVLDVALVNPRDFATDKHRTVDDRPYGGGPGMVMKLEPLVAALRSIPDPGRIVLLTPKGRRLDQKLAVELAAEPVLTTLCGRYEGIDDRLGELFPIEPVSVGDFVLNGGESALLCLMESVSRLLPQFMGKEESTSEESFSSGVLEYPHYTRPEEFEGKRVPEVLLSGNHAVIERWRREQSLKATLACRPDLLAEAEIDAGDLKVLRSIVQEEMPRFLGKNLYIALIHHPVLNKKGEIGTVSLTNLDIHDIARVSRYYGLGGYFLVTPLKDQQELARRIIGHWTEGSGKEAIPDRCEALSLVRTADDLSQVIDAIGKRCGQRPRVYATSARPRGSITPGEIKNRLRTEAVLLLFGTGSGLAGEVYERCDGVLRPMRYLDEYNHLSVRSAAAIQIDRILGDM
ncbi:MAG: tRNA (guanosine(37)-N1)-methyltransferase TrmD, partial [Desulfovibrionales bacterium]